MDLSHEQVIKTLLTAITMCQYKQIKNAMAKRAILLV